VERNKLVHEHSCFANVMSKTRVFFQVLCQELCQESCRESCLVHGLILLDELFLFGTFRYNILYLFQNVGRFGFFRFIVFAMHLDIIYVGGFRLFFWA